MNTAKLIKEARKRLGLSQLQFADALGVGRRAVIKMEQGRTLAAYELIGVQGTIAKLAGLAVKKKKR